MTADIRGGAARRCDSFRVGEHSGVGSRTGKNWGVRGNLSGIAADHEVGQAEVDKLDGSVELVYFSLSYLSLDFQLTEYPS